MKTRHVCRPNPSHSQVPPHLVTVLADDVVRGSVNYSTKYMLFFNSDLNKARHFFKNMARPCGP